MDDLRPYRHEGHRLIELPVQWMLDDWPFFTWYADNPARTIRSTPEVEIVWREELDGIRRCRGTYILTMHPEASARPSRVSLLDRIIEYAWAQADVWIATCAEIAAHADAQLP
jgi:peptidoglycan/xylan/chitin deacetylase (PgdA/CDA1 family)